MGFSSFIKQVFAALRLVAVRMVLIASVFFVFAITLSQLPFETTKNDISEVVQEAERDYLSHLDDLRARMEEGEAISLIVRLEMGYRNEDGQRHELEKINAVKAQIISSLPADGVISTRALSFAPAIVVVTQDPEVLDALIGDNRIRSVWENVDHELHVSQSKQIVHATLPWNENTSTGQSYDGAGYAVAILDTGVKAVLGLTIQAEACFSISDPASYIDTVCPGGSSTPTGSMGQPGSADPDLCNLAGLGCDHGTHVASTAVGAVAGADGIAKAANVIAVQVIHNDRGKLAIDGADIVDGLAWVAYYEDNRDPLKSRVVAVNMSLGSPNPSASTCTLGGTYGAEIVELKKLGITTVASSGNDGFVDSIGYPACIDMPAYMGDPATSVLSVGSVNKYDVVSPFSNSGPMSTVYEVDLLAPGAGIEAAVPSGTLRHMTGTSMASPHVAGCVAVLADYLNSSAPSFADVDLFENALRNTGLPIIDWRDYSIETPRLDCGAAIWNLRGDDHMTEISGTKMLDTTGDGIGDTLVEGWPIEAYSVNEAAPIALDGHPSYSTTTDVDGEYSLTVPWGEYQLEESIYGPDPVTEQWMQISPPLTPVVVEPGSMGPFPGNDFVNTTVEFCPAGQDYKVIVARQKDHFTLPVDQAAPSAAIMKFYEDRYGLNPPVPMDGDEAHYSNRSYIHTFDLSGISANDVITKAKFDFGLRPVVQPGVQGDGTYITPDKRLERNDALWLIFPDADGLIMGNPTAWGRGLGPVSINPIIPGSELGQGLSTSPWDYLSYETRKLIYAETPNLDLVGGGPLYLDDDLRPMMNMHRRVGLLVQDDTGVDVAALHVCTKPPGIEITKTPDQMEFQLGQTLDFDITIENTSANPISDKILITDEIPHGFAGPTIPFSSGDWSCLANATPANGKVSCEYTGSTLVGGATSSVSIPVTAVQAGTYQNCSSVDVVDASANPIIDHNDTCTVNVIGNDIGVRKRKSTDMIRWDDLDTAAIDDVATFTIEVSNYGRELDLSQVTITLEDKITHTGFEYIDPTLIAGLGWECNVPNPVLDLECDYTDFTTLPIPPNLLSGFQDLPLADAHGYPLSEISLDVRGTEIGFFENCARVSMTGVADQFAPNDEWCLNIFVQGNIKIEKSSDKLEYDFGLPGALGVSETIEFLIETENLAGLIDIPLGVVIEDELPQGFVYNSSGPDWTCVSSVTVKCQYNISPIAEGKPAAPFALEDLILYTTASAPGMYTNCAGGNIFHPGPYPSDDQVDEITPPDPDWIGLQTDFDMTNNADCTFFVVGHDVRLFKSASRTFVGAGDALSFDFEITNHLSSIDPGDLLVLKDTLPAGFSLDLPLPSGPEWNCIQTGGTVATGIEIECTYLNPSPPAEAGSLGKFSINVFAPDTIGNYENCADLDVILEQGDLDDFPDNNEDRCTTIYVTGDVSVEKSANVEEADIGDQIIFWLNVTNNGDPIAAPVEIIVRDAIPSGFINVSVDAEDWICNIPNPITISDPVNCTYTPSSGQIIDQGDTLPPINIYAEAAVAGKFTNCAEIGLNGAIDNVPEPEDDRCVVIYVGRDLAIEKSVDNSTPIPGDDITFTLNVRNNLRTLDTPSPDGIVVTDWLPAGLVLLQNPPMQINSDWNCIVTPLFPNTKIECTYTGAYTGLNPVGPETDLQPIIILAEVQNYDALENCAEVSLTGGNVDDILGNNGLVCAAITPPVPDLTITKTGTCNSSGTLCTFEFEITNEGANDYTGPLSLGDMMNIHFSGANITSTLPPGSYGSLSGVIGSSLNCTVFQDFQLGIVTTPFNTSPLQTTLYNSDDLMFCGVANVFIQDGDSISFSVEMDVDTSVIMDGGNDIMNCATINFDGGNYPASCITVDQLPSPDLAITKTLINCTDLTNTVTMCGYTLTITNTSPTTDYQGFLGIADFVNADALGFGAIPPIVPGWTCGLFYSGNSSNQISATFSTGPSPMIYSDVGLCYNSVVSIPATQSISINVGSLVNSSQIYGSDPLTNCALLFYENGPNTITDAPSSCIPLASPSLGALQIVKNVVNTLGVSTQTSFKMGYDCTTSGPSNPLIAVPVGSAGVTISNIAANSNCTVTEAPLSDIQNVAACSSGTAYWETSYAPAQTVPISAGTTATVTVTNELKCQPLNVKWALLINMLIVSPPPGAGWSLVEAKALGNVFDIEVLCDNGYTQTYQFGAGTVSGASLYMPAGTECTISQTNTAQPFSSANCPGPLTWLPPVVAPSQPVTAGPYRRTVVVITNAYICGTQTPPDVGSIHVQKNIVNTTGLSIDASELFSLSVNCTPNLIYGSFELNAGSEGTTFGGLPAGNTCTLTESKSLTGMYVPSAPNCTNGATWTTTSIVPASVTIVANQTAQVTITNTLSCDP